MASHFEGLDSGKLLFKCFMVFTKEKSLKNNEVDYMANTPYPSRILLSWEGKVLDNSCHSCAIIRGIIKCKVIKSYPQYYKT